VFGSGQTRENCRSHDEQPDTHRHCRATTMKFRLAARILAVFLPSVRGHHVQQNVQSCPLVRSDYVRLPTMA
jgi:hypothetical protein